METTSRYLIGLFTTDKDLVIRSWDPGMERVSGIAAPAACGRALAEVIPDLAGRGLLARFAQAVRQGSVEVLAPAFHGYLVACAPQRPSSHFAAMRQKVTITPVSTQGTVSGLVVTVEDVTARMERETELAEGLQSPDETVRLDAARALSSQPATGADHLVHALGDHSWRVRRVAVQALSRHAARDAVAFLLNALRKDHADPAVLNSVLQVLAISEGDVLGTLSALLSDESADLRIYTAIVLGERNDPKAVAALLDALGDPDANVRYHVIEALGKLRAAEAIDPLMRIAASDDFFLAFPALDALARIGDPSVAARIAALLENDLLQTAAAEALGELGDDQTAPLLADMLNRPGAPVAVIARALTAIHERFERRLQEGGHIADRVRPRVKAAGIQQLSEALKASADDLGPLARVLTWLEGPAVETALTRLLGEPRVRKEVVDALVRIGVGVVDRLIGQLASEDLEIRQAVVMALGRIGDVRSVPVLVEALERHPEMMVYTAGALAKIGDRQAFEPLLGFLGHPDPAVRIAIIGALNSIGHPQMPAAIARRLADPDALVREARLPGGRLFRLPPAASRPCWPVAGTRWRRCGGSPWSSWPLSRMQAGL